MMCGCRSSTQVVAKHINRVPSPCSAHTKTLTTQYKHISVSTLCVCTPKSFTLQQTATIALDLPHDLWTLFPPRPRDHRDRSGLPVHPRVCGRVEAAEGAVDSRHGGDAARNMVWWRKTRPLGEGGEDRPSFELLAHSQRWVEALYPSQSSSPWTHAFLNRAYTDQSNVTLLLML